MSCWLRPLSRPSGIKDRVDLWIDSMAVRAMVRFDPPGNLRRREALELWSMIPLMVSPFRN